MLGAGTLGEIVISALLDAGWPTSAISAMESRRERAEELSVVHGIAVSVEPDAAIFRRRVLVVAVKPKDVDALLGSIAPMVDWRAYDPAR